RHFSIFNSVLVFSDSPTQEKDQLLETVTSRLPGLLFDVLALQDPSETPQPENIYNLHWCTCNNCRETDSDIERLCCRMAPDDCISKMAYMDYYILDDGVLRLARAAWNDIFAIEDAQEPGVEQRQYRHAAYRQFVLWQHGHLGQGNRVAIPSCCVWRIRSTFPDPRGHYTGFRVHRLAA
uniref:P2X purinoreceptor 7 intracellular domain-containing protein n=1 Tax=Nothobranchius furzeri TaxID=105023 RepID=A0A8C6NLE7_NOTFU